MQHLRDPEGTFSPTGSGMAECSAQQSTETPQRDPKASTLSADNSLLSWTWLLRETGQQGGRWTRPVLSQGDVLTETALVENTKGGCCFTPTLQKKHRTRFLSPLEVQ